MHYMDGYESWLSNALIDEDTKNELRGIAGNDKEIEDRFYKCLDFGTAGLRGIIGAGTNRMNKYTLKLAAQGFANFLKKIGKDGEKLSIVIAHDSRRLSREFTLWCAEVMAGNGIKAYIYDSMRSTPELSFAVSHLKCSGGAVVTASHNPPEYNGFKVYGSDGCQLVPELADMVTEEANKVTELSMINSVEYEEGLSSGLIEVLDESVDNAYMDAAMANLQNTDSLSAMRDRINVVYTPLHGTGGRPVKAMLQRLGVDNLTTVDEQMVPDSDFSTVKLPNPEDISAFDLGIEYANRSGADLIIATDPDADRVGIAVRNDSGGFRLFSGNETGALLLEYVATTYKKPENPAVISTVVTSSIARTICERNGIEFFETLTGFKFIGEKIAQFKGELPELYGTELKGKYNFLFGYEESYGYLVGTHARDKDAVVTTALILEMYAYYLQNGVSLEAQLRTIYGKYGYFTEYLKSVSLSGKEGLEKIASIMKSFRGLDADSIGGLRLSSKTDYDNDETGLRKSDVIKFRFECGSWFAARPSGTEPKLKIYFAVVGESEELSRAKLGRLVDAVGEMIL